MYVTFALIVAFVKNKGKVKWVSSNIQSVTMVMLKFEEAIFPRFLDNTAMCLFRRVNLLTFFPIDGGK